jgi:GNAT superfamily N-acetyltransferase
VSVLRDDLAVSSLIRLARRDDAPRLQAIEVAAGEQFRTIGYDNVADEPPDSIEALTWYAEAQRSWVAVAGENSVVGYILVSVVDDAAHIDQVSVHPAHQGAGLGKALIERAKQWARDTGRSAVTLTTFSEVPWNRALYEHLGFEVVQDDEIGPDLRAVIQHEAAKGFGPEDRVAMRLGLELGGRD